MFVMMIICLKVLFYHGHLINAFFRNRTLVNRRLAYKLKGIINGCHHDFTSAV